MIIQVDGRQVQNHTSFTISTSIAHVADKCIFSTALFDELTLNKEVEVLLDEDIQLFPATIDRVTTSGSFGRWQARSTTARLVDSCPVVDTGEFRNRTTKQIIQTIAAPFDIIVQGDDGVAFDKYNLELDVTCSEVIAELCIFSGVIASTNSEGVLVIQKLDPSESAQIVCTLQDGVNCQMQFSADERSIASEYRVLGQHAFNKGDKPTISNGSRTGTHPVTKVATIMSRVSANSIQAQVQADWLRNYYESSIEMLSCRIQGIRQLYKGQTVLVHSSKDRIYDSKRLIESVRYVLDEGTGTGTSSSYTVLVLVYPSKYGGEPVAPSGWVGS